MNRQKFGELEVRVQRRSGLTSEGGAANAIARWDEWPVSLDGETRIQKSKNVQATLARRAKI